MKQIATPIIPQTSVVGTADKALETAFKAADTALDTAYKAADKTISDTVASNKTAQDLAISSAIAEWAADRQYKANNICIKNRTFFYAIKDNAGKDPLTDTAGNWSIFVPNEANSIFANRSPVSSDVHPAGLKWYDVSYGADTPLIMISLGNGAWQYLNQITLSRVRFYVGGTNSTYQSRLSSIKFYKKDGTQMPDSWWVWGARSGLGGQNAGVSYTGQNMGAGYNASGWAELEPNSNFDLSESITKVTGSTAYASVSRVDFYFSNGGVKIFTPGGGNLATCDPPIQARIGNAIASVLGEILTAAKLSSPISADPGRVTGESFVQAWNILSQAVLGRVTALESKTVTLEAALSLLIDRQPEVAPEHAAAQVNARGEFVNLIPGGGILTYSNSRNAGTNTFNFPRNVYQSVVSYYANVAGDAIPMTTTTQAIAADAMSLEIPMILVSSEAITFVIEFHMRGNRVDVYEVPLV